MRPGSASLYPLFCCLQFYLLREGITDEIPHLAGGSVMLHKRKPALYRSSFFSRFAKWAAYAMGHPVAFMAAILVIIAWSMTGPMFGFSDTWQLVINTGTTIVTFLMVFLIQNTQNRDSAAIQLKL